MVNRRRQSKHLRAPRPLLAGGSQSKVQRRGVDYIVRDVPAQRSEKEYRCPGCSQRVAPGTAHVVVWPREPSLGASSAVAERRHWHTSCWQRRR